MEYKGIDPIIAKTIADKIRILVANKDTDSLIELANKLDPKGIIDASLRGWVMVTTHEGSHRILWASEDGLSENNDGGWYAFDWEEAYEYVVRIQKIDVSLIYPET